MHKVIVKQAAIYRASNTIRWFATPRNYRDKNFDSKAFRFERFTEQK